MMFQLRVHNLIERRFAGLLFLIIMISGLGTAFYMYSADKYALTYYGDASSHLILTRKLFDWKENPGWNQLGTVWLPLPHFLLMLPSSVDSLFFTGFAGLAVSLPSLAFTSIFLYKIIVQLLKKARISRPALIPYIALAGALLYSLNPNFIYLGITAMTEAPFMLFFVGAGHYLLRWIDEYRAGKSAGLWYLAISSIFVSAATLSRYEGWILPLVLIASVLVTTLRGRRIAGTEEGERRSVLYALVIMTISLTGVGFWLSYNYVNYDDAFEFANAQYYSAASQAINRPIRESLFLQPYNVISVYGITAIMVYGPVLLSAALIGYLFLRRSRDPLNCHKHLFVFLASAPVFTIVSMIIGIGEMTLWFNSRFVIFLSPLLISLAAFYIAKQPIKIASNNGLFAGVIIGLFIFQPIIVASDAIVTLADAEGGFTYRHTPSAIATGEKLNLLYDGNGAIMIITGSAQEQRIMIASGIALKNFDSIIETSTWKQSFREPWNHNVTLMVISKDPDSDAIGVVGYWDEHEDELSLHYRVVYETKYHRIMDRI